MEKQSWLYVLVLCAALQNWGYGQEVAAPPKECSINFSKVGCFKEKQLTMVPILSYRDMKGPELDWKNFAASIRKLACHCGEESSKQGYRYFALRYWGECHAGKEVTEMPALLNDPTKKSKRCANGTFQECTDSHAGECVGKGFTEYLYIIGKQIEYHGVWTKCSKSCGSDGLKTTNSCTGNMGSNGFRFTCGKMTMKCNNFPCNLNFGNWGPCSKPCGGGHQFRFAVCPSNVRSGQYGAQYICRPDGRIRDKQRCNTHKC